MEVLVDPLCKTTFLSNVAVHFDWQAKVQLRLSSRTIGLKRARDLSVSRSSWKTRSSWPSHGRTGNSRSDPVDLRLSRHGTCQRVASQEEIELPGSI